MKSTDVRSASDGDDACWRATGGLGGGLALASRLRSSSFSSSNEKNGKGNTSPFHVTQQPAQKIRFLCQNLFPILPSARPAASLLIGVLDYNLT